MFKEIFLGKEKIFSSNVFIFHAALILISFIFVYIFSYSTSFRYDLLGGDSSIFQSIGKYWAQGHLPYVELFEHKGPLLFFIDAIGYAIYPRSGIMVPQIIFLYLSCVFIWRAMELYSSSWKIFFLIFFLAVALFFFAVHYDEGNHVEEYSVLFLSAAAYFFLKALKDSEGKKFFHPPLYGFIYGFGFGACVLIRTSDAAQICCQTFLAAIFLLQARDFKNLLQNVLSFCAGFAAIVLPFVIYFAAHGALYDMLYGTILFNLKYAGTTAHLHRMWYYLLHFFLLFVMIIVAALMLKQNPKSRLLWSAIFIGAMVAILLMKLRPYGHYAMIIFSAVPILFAVLYESRNELQKIWQASGLSFKRIILKALIIFAVIDACVFFINFKEYYLAEKNSMPRLFVQYEKRFAMSNPNEHEEILKLRSIIPDNEKDSFVCWGYYCNTPHWVIYTDMKPREREFFLNSFHSRIDPAIREEWFENVRKDYPLWILYGTDPDRKPGEPPKTSMEDSELEQLLEEKYLFKGEVYVFPQMLKLYRLKE